MQVYINNVLRTDVLPQIGGAVSQTAAHKTSSTISAAVPVASTDLQSCDYIKITDGAETVLAGTILGLDQQDMGTATDSQTDKIYTLTIASNADFIASIFVDLQFPAGANMAQVLLGNHPGAPYYSVTFAEFYGIFEERLAAEGITLGTIDDFSNYTLSDPALLWGQYVSDKLDSLSSTAGAWWEITPDMVFNMRYNSATEDAPLQLDENADVYDIQPSRDSYTMYSAVRVVGGLAGAPLLYADLSATGQNNAAYISATKITLKYPIAVLNAGTQYHGFYEYDAVRYAMNFGYCNPRIGYHGIDDNNPNVDVLISYGSPDIDAVNGFTFATMTGTNRIRIPYYPLVTIFTRLQLDDLVDEIKAQRGGTGVIETTLTDDSLASFTDAATAGVNFLRDNAKRAMSVKFKTLVPGYKVGQTLRDSSIPYYGISGDYKVGAITASIIRNDAGGLVWEYEIEASNINYRDKLKALIYTQQKSSFKIGTDFPAADGRYAYNEISIQSTVDFEITQPETWDAFEARNLTWGALEALGQTCAQLENVIEEWSVVANLLNQNAKNQIAAFLNGESPNASLLQMDFIATCIGGGAEGTGTSGTPSVTPPIRSNSDITTIFYFDESAVVEAITGFDFNNGPDLSGQQNVPPVTNAHIDVIIDKTATNPKGPFALTITKRDSII